VTLVVVEVVVVKQNIMRASFCLYYHSSATACVVLLLVEVVEVLEAYSGTHAMLQVACYHRRNSSGFKYSDSNLFMLAHI